MQFLFFLYPLSLASLIQYALLFIHVIIECISSSLLFINE